MFKVGQRSASHTLANRNLLTGTDPAREVVNRECVVDIAFPCALTTATSPRKVVLVNSWCPFYCHFVNSKLLYAGH